MSRPLASAAQRRRFFLVLSALLGAVLIFGLPALGDALLADPALQPYLQSNLPVDTPSASGDSLGEGGDAVALGSSGDGAAPGAAGDVDSKQRICVQLEVDGSAAGGGEHSFALQLEDGSSAYDALLASGLQLNARSSQFGVYVLAIDGIVEKSHGAQSGWKYELDGAYVGTSADKCILQDGQSLRWYFSADGWR